MFLMWCATVYWYFPFCPPFQIKTTSVLKSSLVFFTTLWLDLKFLISSVMVDQWCIMWSTIDTVFILNFFESKCAYIYDVSWVQYVWIIEHWKDPFLGIIIWNIAGSVLFNKTKHFNKLYYYKWVLYCDNLLCLGPLKHWRVSFSLS